MAAIPAPVTKTDSASATPGTCEPMAPNAPVPTPLKVIPLPPPPERGALPPPPELRGADEPPPELRGADGPELELRPDEEPEPDELPVVGRGVLDVLDEPDVVDEAVDVDDAVDEAVVELPVPVEAVGLAVAVVVGAPPDVVAVGVVVAGEVDTGGVAPVVAGEEAEGVVTPFMVTNVTPVVPYLGFITPPPYLISPIRLALAEVTVPPTVIVLPGRATTRSIFNEPRGPPGVPPI